MTDKPSPPFLTPDLPRSPPGLVAQARQLIAEAGLEAGVGTDDVDDAIFFRGVSATLDEDAGLWDDDNRADDEGQDMTVDSRTASVVYRFVHSQTYSGLFLLFLSA